MLQTTQRSRSHKKYVTVIDGLPQAVYTSKQVCEVIGIDPKTFRDWRDELRLEPATDSHDQRVRLYTDDQVRQLIELSKQRQHVSGVPRATTPLGGYRSSVKKLSQRVNDVEERAVSDHADTLQVLDMLKKGLTTTTREVSTIKQAVTSVSAEVERKNTDAIKQLEDEARASAKRFSELAAKLDETLATFIELAKSLGIEVGENKPNQPPPAALSRDGSPNGGETVIVEDAADADMGREGRMMAVGKAL